MSISVGSKLENKSVPVGLSPEHATSMFPMLSAETLSDLRSRGFGGIGIVAAIFSNQGELLIEEHVSTKKLPRGGIGPLAETIKKYGNEVESIEMSLARGMSEEAGISNPDSMTLRAKSRGAWATYSHWPIGRTREALAITPAVILPPGAAEQIVNQFQSNAEISAVDFVPLDKLGDLQNLRPGVKDWMGAVALEHLFHVPSKDMANFTLPALSPATGGRDALWRTIHR